MRLPWSSKWSPKKTPPRRSQSLNNLATLDANQRVKEFGIDSIDNPTELRLGNGPTLKFENGNWTTADGQTNNNINDAIVSQAANRELVQLRKDTTRLTEENNMLKIKIEILLDMMTEITEMKNQQAAQPNFGSQPSLNNLPNSGLSMQMHQMQLR